MDLTFEQLGVIMRGLPEWLTIAWPSVSLADALKIAFVIISGCYGILKTWQFSEQRIYERLLEYLQREEKRLADARSRVASTITKRVPGDIGRQPVYSNIALGKALKAMRFGRAKKAHPRLEEAIGFAKEKIEVSSKLLQSHRNQLATSYVLLGAMADADAKHIIAFDNFQKALEIVPDDPEVLEYSGLQQLRVPNAAQAIEIFRRLEALGRSRNDALVVARGIHYQAQAYMSLPKPDLNAANRILLPIIGAFPAVMPQIERAEIHELHGNVRRDLKFRNSNDSYTNALTIYSTVHAQKRADVRARDGIARVTAEIAKLNAVAAPVDDGVVAQAGPRMNADASNPPNPPAHPPQ